MSDWKTIRLTSALQVAELMDAEPEGLPGPDVSVRAHYEALRAQGLTLEALEYIGHALPRLEAIWWAAHLLESEARKRALPPLDRQALDHALRWLGDPDDDRRRAASEAADAAAGPSPERLLALAVFLSGGSISLPDLPPVLPGPAAACRLAGSAVMRAAYRTDTPEQMLEQALALAEKVAETGIFAREGA